VVRAAVAGRWALSVLGPGRTGVVLATFERSCYLDVDGQVVALVGEALPPGPFTVVAEGAPPFSALAVGAPVTATADSLQIGDLTVDLAAVACWNATLAPWTGDRDHLRGHLEVLRQLLADSAPSGGLAPLALHPDADSPLAPAVRPALRTLAAGLRDGVPEAVARAAHRLAGLGPGLTPSGDDILTGCLLALSLWPGRGGVDLRPLIVARAVPRTTRISAAYLTAAGRGEAGRDWHVLRDALAGPDPDAVRRSASQVMALGETSGSDMLGGFVLAAQALRAA
jgi:hypothetical protein